MTNIVVAAALDLAGPHRQQGLGAVERLDLGLLIHRKHHRLLGRMRVQPHHIGHLLQVWILAELERAGSVRLKWVAVPDAVHRLVADLEPSSQCACARVGRAAWWSAQCHANDAGHQILPVGAAPARLTAESIQTGLAEALAPLAHRWQRALQPRGNLQIGRSGGRPAGGSWPAGPVARARPGSSTKWSQARAGSHQVAGLWRGDWTRPKHDFIPSNMQLFGVTGH